MEESSCEMTENGIETQIPCQTLPNKMDKKKGSSKPS